MAEIDIVEEEARMFPARESNQEIPEVPEVSLFINGREFTLDGVGKPGGPTLLSRLEEARVELLQALEHPKQLARMIDMSPKEAVAFTREQLTVLSDLVRQVEQATSRVDRPRGEPDEINY